MLKKAFCSILLGYISTFAVCMQGTTVVSGAVVQKMAGEVSGIRVEAVIVLACLCSLYYKRQDILFKKVEIIPFVIAALFSGFTLIGLSYTATGNWEFIFKEEKQFLIALFTGAGYFFLYYLCLLLLFSHLGKLRKNSGEANRIRIIPNFFKKHFLLSCTLCMLFFWSPYVITHFPGSVPSDGYTQLALYFGFGTPSNHHPWIVTLFFGSIMSLGRVISDNVGVGLLIVVMSIIEALCYAEICNKLYKWNCPELGIVAALLFYCIVPPFGAYAQAVIKDSLFFALFALYISFYAEICLFKLKLKENVCLKKIIIFTLISILVCLCRNNGFYMVLPANIILVFLLRKKKKIYLAGSLFCLIFVWICYNSVFLPLSDVQPGSKREMLSVPFQQTARYISSYPDEVTQEEKNAIAKVLDYEHIAANYNPEVSDQVKNTFNEHATNEELKNYFRVWLQMFFKHPAVYIQSFLANSYGYIYPFSNHDIVDAYQFYIRYEPQKDPEKGLNIYYVFDYSVRKSVEGWSELWRTAPGLSQILNPGTYSWILFVLIGILIKYRQWRYIHVMTAPFLNIAVCCMSPVNGLLRYSWPLAAGMPVLIFVTFVCVRRFKKKQVLYANGRQFDNTFQNV